MKQPIAWLALAAAALALLLAVRRPEPVAPVQDSGPEDADRESSHGQQDESLAHLRGRIVELERRVAELSLARALAERAPVAVAVPAAQDAHQIAGMATIALGVPVPSDAPVPSATLDAVRQVLDEERKSEKDEREARHVREQQQWLQDTRTELGLDDQQTQRLQDVAREVGELRAENRARRERGEISRRQERAMERVALAGFDEKMRTVLTADQLARSSQTEPRERHPPPPQPPGRPAGLRPARGTVDSAP